MQIFGGKSQIHGLPSVSVALGFFDGVHLGHRVLIERSISYARKTGNAAAVFTFRDHPKNVISGTTCVKRLLSEADRNKIFESLGIDYVFEFDFADGFHEMSPDAFAGDLLCNTFGASAVFCGYNFRFGALARGDADTLRALGVLYGFEVDVVDRVEVGGQPVSSTRIRALIEKGKVCEANRLLGEDFRLSGTVLHGNARGRTIGFPTANFKPDPVMVWPSYGVYATTVSVPGTDKPLPAVTNFGTRPTVGGKETLAETHIFGYTDDLYGKEIVVTFCRHLREEKKFDTFEALKQQIEKDKAAAGANLIVCPPSGSKP
ncbi:MAG: bifunctional riboflavin kinase/FAD synthetase [Clostridiales Family XIII bacterium]|jgi:riboflavin kinase/FMN adenylyltransferase|nr:bifunctional riboflavin kinase/FAD synthetase [Clostridiales Family XIII bacterium]